MLDIFDMMLIIKALDEVVENADVDPVQCQHILHELRSIASQQIRDASAVLDTVIASMDKG